MGAACCAPTWLRALILVLALLLAGCGYYGHGIKTPELWVQKDVPYAAGYPGDAALKLNVYSSRAAALLPVVIYVHGGGWTEGDKEQMDVWCRMIAARGYAVFDVNYRLAPEFKFPAAADDVMGAVIWVRDHAPEYNGDPDRIGISGGSAGSHLAALATTAVSDAHFRPTGHEQQSAVGIIKAAVLFFGVYDFEKPGLIRLTSIPRDFLGDPKAARENYRVASPIKYSCGGVPPTMLIVGRLDPIYSQTRRYYESLLSHGAPVELKVYPFETHGFDIWMSSPDARDAFERMMAFFDRNLKRR